MMKKIYKTYISKTIRNIYSLNEKCPRCLIELSVSEYKLFQNNSIILSGLSLDTDQDFKFQVPSYKHIHIRKNICIHEINKCGQKMKRVDIL